MRQRVVNKAAIETEIAKLMHELLGYDVDCIFNMDETGLFYKCLPNASYVTWDRGDARGTKALVDKDRYSVKRECVLNSPRVTLVL